MMIMVAVILKNYIKANKDGDLSYDEQAFLHRLSISSKILGKGKNRTY